MRVSELEAEWRDKYRAGRKKNWSSGWRTIGGKKCFFRSRWEANYARYLQLQKENGAIIDWEFEKETFWFDGIMRGTCSFLVDFRITIEEKDNDSELPGFAPKLKYIYAEVKGWKKKKDDLKFKRMKIYHPSIKLFLVDGTWFKKHEKWCIVNIPDWEKS